MTEEQLLEYEVGSMTLAGSIFYSWFTQLFARKCKRKWKRYTKYMAMKYERKVMDFIKTKLP